ncbi:MAG: HlyD family type I secretion periplasmic adaptor subunit [Leptolyngbya sp. SIO4C1]|nr:HlyD family type I secretion periplasmic adaptor subunit [Leptolyngbya sp. SIO4C1]
MTSRINQNGVSQNGVSANGSVQPEATEERQFKPLRSFDQPVILRQSPRWAIAIVWTILAVTTASVAWACLAKVEETVPAQGKLEPEGVVQSVQAPVGGVIEEIHVQEGEIVDQGEPLISFDQTAAQAEIETAKDLQGRLVEENEFYRAQLSGDFGSIAPDSVSADLRQRMRDREALLANNKLYRAQLGGSTSDLNEEQRTRLNTASSALSSQQRINALQVNQLTEQLDQTQIQLSNAKSDLSTNREILERLARLNEEGAVAELSYLQQQQEVNNKLTEVNTLTEEAARLRFQIAQAEREIDRTRFESDRTLQDRIAANDERVAQIDSQLTQLILESEKQLQELNSQISQLDQTLRYQVLTAPVAGTVFNLKANQPGYAANSTEPILEIVPEDALVARVYVPNKDIGFVRIGQPVDVRIDAFSYSEFGDVDGEIISIGSDALPPDEIYPYYRFPVEIDLESQTLNSNGAELMLRTGMSVNANIKLRKRRVITFFTDLFVRKADSLRSGG